MDKMEKNEILRRAQAQKGQDEREAQVYQRSHYVSMAMGLITCIVLFFIKKIYAGESGRDVMGLYFTMMAASYFYKWYQLRRISDLVWALISVIIAGMDLGTYIVPLCF
ncbi:MAG: hypothetical protein HFF00_01790 [Ruminiclostridium sp.]|jgi:hypothetical protein|nr:hypothetical protein [Ruminiclostridium sp.]